MLRKKRKSQYNNNKNHHLIYDDFYRETEEISLIDLGEENFINHTDHSNPTKEILEIPEMNQKKGLILTPASDPLQNLSYPKHVQYVNKKYQKQKFKRLKKLKQMKKTLMTIIIICFLLLGGIIYEIIQWQRDNKDTKKQIEQINKEVKIEEIKIETPATSDQKENQSSDDYFEFQKLNMLNVDFNQLLTRNPQTVGWIKVEGISINYPFVQTTNNDYYLTHSFNKKNNEAGWIFLDYRNDINHLSQNTVIYGHGRLNNTMFGSLKKVVKKSWYKDSENQIVKISTPNQNTIWQVFSTYTIDPETYYLTTNFSDNQSYIKFIDTIKSRSVYNYPTEVTINDHILTLSSCYDDQKRVVLHAKLIHSTKR